MSKDNLDKFFQQKANERSFEFEDDYWKDMELLLEDEDDKKTPVPFWWQNGRLLLGSLIAIIAIGTFYMTLKQSSNKSNLNNTETSILNQNTSNSNNSTISSKDIEAINSNNAENTTADNTTNTLNNNSSNTNNQTTSTKRSNSTNSSNKNNQNGNTVSSNRRNSSDKNNSPNSVNDPSYNTNNLDNTNPKGLATQVATDNSSSNNGSSNNTTGSSDSDSNTTSRTNGESSKDEKPIVAFNRDAEKTLSEKTKFNFLDLIDLSEVDEILNALKTKLPKPTKEGKTDPPSPKDFIAIGVNVGASRYFYDTDFQNEQPYSPTAGVYVNFPVSKNLSLGTGFNYWSRGNINASSSGDSTVFNFGFQEITTTDFVSRATYLEIPLLLRYRIKEKHIAEIGGNFSYLLTARGSRTVKISDDFGTTDLSYNVTDGYKSWLNSSDVALRLGYHYQWNKRGTIGLQWQYGLMDVTPDNIYDNIIFDRNHQFKVVLGYDLIRIQTKKK